MERLTTREHFPHGAEGISKDRLTGKWCRGIYQATAVTEKLAEYEDAEEKGLLLRLPCRVGAKVYAFIPGDNHFTECQVNKIEIKTTIYGKMCYFVEPTGKRGRLYKYFEYDFGKNIFTKKQSAADEQKLREKGGQSK